MGNTIDIPPNYNYNYNIIRFDKSNYLQRHLYHIEINKLDANTLKNLELKINKLDYKFIHIQDNIEKILKILKYYINNETQYNLSQIDAFNFNVYGKLKFQLINVNAKSNQDTSGVNTNYYYYKVCELTHI